MTIEIRSSLRKAVGLLSVLAVLTSSSAVLAAEPETETVRAAVWDEMYIYVEDTPICIADENDNYRFPLNYQGTVYIPLQTASEWLGCEFTWDREGGRVTLTPSGEPYYRHAIRDQPDALTEEEMRQLDEDMKNGVEMELCPDLKVYLAGDEQAFANVNGRETPPALCRGTVLLPVRGVARMCGKEITYLPPRSPSPGVNSLSLADNDFDLLYEPVLYRARNAHIFLYDTPTQTQLDEAQAFLDEADQLLYDGPVGTTAEFLAQESLSSGETAVWLQRIYAEVDRFATLFKPEALFINLPYEALLGCTHSVKRTVSDYIDAMEKGEMTFDDLKRDDGFSSVMTQRFYSFRFNIADGQYMLDAVREQMGQAN